MTPRRATAGLAPLALAALFAGTTAAAVTGAGASGCACPPRRDAGPTSDAASDAAPGTDAAPDAGPPPPCGLPVGEARDARLVAVGYAHRLADAESYGAYHAAIAGLMKNVVGPCLDPAVPTLVVFPEDTLLVAALIGSRGANARAAGDSLFAFLQLHGGYAGAVAYYDALYPGLTLNQQVALVVTDTLWRVLSGTFAALAAQYGVVVAVTGNFADAVPSSDPADVAALSDPDLDPPPDSVWVAVAPEVYNQTIFFGPDGAELARRRKVYLVPDEIDLLQLSSGALTDLVPVDLGFTRAGVVISKDAWMPDVLDRLAMGGAAVMLQPEAFSGWAVPEVPGEWSPDVVMESGWSHVQKFPEFRYGAMASLSGNFFDLVFDSQSDVAADGGGWAPGGVAEATLGAYVGNDPVPGLAHVGDWAIPDPGLADAALSLVERRALLEAYGVTLLPGAGPPNENAYVASHAAADLWLPPDGVFPAAEPLTVGPLALGASVRVADWTSGTQSHPAVAVGDASGIGVVESAYVVWEDDRSGTTRVYFARSDDGLASFTSLVPVAPPGAGGGSAPGAPQTLPVVAANGDTVHVVWQEYTAPDTSHLFYARSLDGGTSWETPVELPAGAVGVVPAGPRWQPAIAVDGTLIVVAYAATELLPEVATRIWVSGSGDAGATWLSRAVDSTAPTVDEPNRRNQWSPAVAITPGGVEIYVGWIDFRSYNWDVYATRSLNVGASFAPPVRIDDAGPGFERLHDDVAFASGPGGQMFAAWTDLRARGPVYAVRGARIDGLAADPPSVPLASAPLSRWSPSLAWAPDGRLAVTWQDFRDGTNDAYVAVSADGGINFGAALRLDDAGDSPTQQFFPRLAIAPSGTAYAVWLDTRGSFPRIRAAAGPLP